MQASDESIALLSVLVQGLGRNGLYRRQGILDAVFHLFHEQLLLLLSPLALVDIPSDFGSADDPAVGIFERRYRERNVDQTSVLAATDSIVMINTLPTAHAFDDFWIFIKAICRYQDRDRLADDLIRLIAKQPLGTAIPASNDAVEVLADNRVV